MAKRTWRTALKFIAWTHLGLFPVLCQNAFSQVSAYEEGSVRYRVVAHKSGDESITSESNTQVANLTTTVYCPNAFTPDQDGVNDFFITKGLNAADFQMEIYNRWGEMIFRTDNVRQAWDGTYQGRPAPQGAYVYKLKARDMKTGREINRTGTVTLLR